MTVRIGALVFSSPRPAATVEFYRLIGIDLAEEDHGDGVAHWACEVEMSTSPCLRPTPTEPRRVITSRAARSAASLSKTLLR